MLNTTYRKYTKENRLGKFRNVLPVSRKVLSRRTVAPSKEGIGNCKGWVLVQVLAVVERVAAVLAVLVPSTGSSAASSVSKYERLCGEMSGLLYQ